MPTNFILSFSIAIGSFIMLLLNLFFYGNSITTMILGASIAFNSATLATYYRKESIEALKKIFIRK